MSLIGKRRRSWTGRETILKGFSRKLGAPDKEVEETGSSTLLTVLGRSPFRFLTAFSTTVAFNFVYLLYLLHFVWLTLQYYYLLLSFFLLFAGVFFGVLSWLLVLSLLSFFSFRVFRLVSFLSFSSWSRVFVLMCGRVCVVVFRVLSLGGVG